MTLEEGACAVRMWWAIKASRVCLSIARQIKRLVDRPPNDFSMAEEECNAVALTVDPLSSLIDRAGCCRLPPRRSQLEREGDTIA